MDGFWMSSCCYVCICGGSLKLSDHDDTFWNYRFGRVPCFFKSAVLFRKEVPDLVLKDMQATGIYINYSNMNST